MPSIALLAATLWLQLQLVVAYPTYSDLVRIPRDVWDTELWARDTADTASIGLTDHETFKWASTDAPHSKAVVVSMVAYSRQDELILDMDKFSFALDSVTCTEEVFSVRFKHALIYKAAKIAWQWVNYNDMRSFVLVSSWKGCGSHDPWVVTKVEFDDKSQKVIFDATKSTWKKVMSTFILDFGEVVLGDESNNNKRDIIPDLDEKFRLNLEATLPEEIFRWEVRNGALNGTLTANCDECGTAGTLVFAGHVEASLGWGGVEVDKFEISITPQGVQAHLGLSLEFEGELDYRQFTRPSQELEILNIPVSGWNIPGIFEFGPRILLNAGYAIDYIGGRASVSTGITARIPDSATAKLDLLAEDQLEVSGWAPVVETDPLEIQAMIDAQARLYTEIALSVSLTVLEDNGFGVDLSLKVPELTVTTTAGLDSNGFCEVGGNPWGVNIEASIGANLKLEGWKELDGSKDILFDATLFEKEDLYEFPQFCLSFSELSEGYCLPEDPVPGEENVEEDEPADSLAVRSTADISIHVKRQRPSNRDPIYLTCGTGKDHSYRVLRYNGPSVLKTNNDVPIIHPKVSCKPSETDCLPNTDIEVLTDQGRAAVFVKRQGDKRTWATEHIYEGNWIREFLDFLHEEKFNNESTCSSHVAQFFDEDISPPATVPNPGPDTPPTYLHSLLQNLGTIYTQTERMVLIPQKQNKMKFDLFAKNELVGYFYQDKDSQSVGNNHERRTCDIARIVTVCKYMDSDVARAGMRATVEALEGVLAEMDKDTRITPADFSYVAAHQEWFERTYREGIEHAREKLTDYAIWMVGNPKGDQWDDLSDQAQDEIRELAGGSPDWDKYCPFTPREGW
ncbi:hypothetical protein BJY04DRAFT_229120 [Aspergillus karnatakaensis]|uniref:uncharacterized protein n=1 Tax=Aspergillus karnatakaensis TaxID=1810916 RepID=UPI003CCD2157